MAGLRAPRASPLLQANQLEAAAAQVRHQSARRRKGRNHAERGVACLLLARQDAEREAGLPGHGSAEARAVNRVADRGRCHRVERADAERRGGGGEAAQRIERGLHRVGRERPGLGQRSAEATELALVEDRRRRAREAPRTPRGGSSSSRRRERHKARPPHRLALRPENPRPRPGASPRRPRGEAPPAAPSPVARLVAARTRHG